MAITRKDGAAPIETVKDLGRRCADFYKLPPPPARRPDGTIVDERFQRPDDDRFKRQPGRS